MSKILFVLGAGVSKDAKIPLMADFFEQANLVASSLSPRDEELRQAFALVAKGRANLQSAQSKAYLDLRNLESVFGAFEMVDLLFDEALGTLTREEIGRLGDAMRQVIVGTFEHSMILEAHQKGIYPPQHFREFGGLVRGLADSGHDVSIVTFNYDIAVELGLVTTQLRSDYWLKGSEGPARRADEVGVPVLKLHGSLNWFRCARCREILVQPVHDVVNDAQRNIRLDVETAVKLFPSAAAKHITCLRPECEASPCEPVPAIIPPTVYKTDAHRELGLVWREAAKRLRNADNIFVIGYSWPMTDQFFHNLFAVGSIGTTILSRFWVCNPDLDVIKRFQDRLLGQQARDCFGPLRQDDADTFDRAILQIRQAFKVGNAVPRKTILGNGT